MASEKPVQDVTDVTETKKEEENVVVVESSKDKNIPDVLDLSTEKTDENVPVKVIMLLNELVYLSLV